MIKLKSFEDFSQFQTEQQAAKLAEQQAKQREETTLGFKQLLAEYGVASLSELSKEQKVEFFTKLEGESVTESRRTMAELKDAEKIAKKELALLQQQYKLNKTETNLARIEAKKGKLDRIKMAMKSASESNDTTPNEINEARSINKIQNEWSKVTAEMSAKAQEWKAAEGDAKAKLLDQLKSLTAKKKALEAELEDAVSGKDRDLELVIKEANSLTEGFEVHYSDGMRAMQKFNDKNKAIAFMKDKIANNKNLKEIAVYNASGNFHSTADADAVVAWWGDGSYLDNVSKKDAKLAAKKLDESAVTEAEIKSDEEFKEYAFTVLKKAFGEDFDEAKAQEVIDGVLSKAKGDYGTAVGMLQSSLG